MRHRFARFPSLALVVSAALLACPTIAGAVDITFGTSWDNVPLQQILDTRYGVGVINVATDYEGHNPGDADPAYWQDLGLNGLIVREIAGFSNRNTLGWYEESLVGAPVIDGNDDGIVFDGPLSAGATASISFPNGLTRFGFYLNPNGTLDGGAHAPEPELFFTNRFYNDKGTNGVAATHAPFNGDPQCLVFNITHLSGGVPTYVLAWEDLDYGTSIAPSYNWSKTDNDFNDLVIEIQALSPVGVETQTWGSVKALFRQ
ncbi:MAG: DUF4114 domain-containing protein [bacterium]|nr:DUF4114 domain-containing protein [bacterium]